VVEQQVNIRMAQPREHRVTLLALTGKEQRVILRIGEDVTLVAAGGQVCPWT
jgi:hypothetical protein